MAQSPITNPTVEVSFLSDIFPNLTYIDAWDTCEEGSGGSGDDEENTDTANEGNGNLKTTRHWQQVKSLYEHSISTQEQQSE
jgi:hypothetical protein